MWSKCSLFCAQVLYKHEIIYLASMSGCVVLQSKYLNGFEISMFEQTYTYNTSGKSRVFLNDLFCLLALKNVLKWVKADKCKIFLKF